MQTPPSAGPDSIEVMSATELIRRRPNLFFAEGRPTQQALIDRVLKDVSDCPDCEAQVRLQDDWVLVRSDTDWMAPGGFVFGELFKRFVARRGGGLFADRAEIFILATARGLLTTGTAGDFASGLTQADLPPALAEALPGAARALVWRL